MSVSSSREVLPPSEYSLSVFSAVVNCGVVAATVVDETARTLGAVSLSEALPFAVTVDAAAPETVDVTLLAVLVATVPASYAFAARRIDEDSIA